MERWASDFNSWDICDDCCGLFARTPFAYQKALEWSEREEEFVKRAAFSLIARLAMKSSRTSDEQLESFLPVIVRESTDDRNMVRKAVNWALRQIGKRHARLNAKAIETARQIKALDSRSARWIASDALRELTGEAVQVRLQRRVKV